MLSITKERATLGAAVIAAGASLRAAFMANSAGRAAVSEDDATRPWGAPRETPRELDRRSAG